MWTLNRKPKGYFLFILTLQNPDFAAIAKVVGLWGRFVSKPAELEESVKEWLAQPGPALLHVKVAPMQLVMPPAIVPEAAMGMVLYTAKAVLHGKGDAIWEMFKENL